MFERLPPKEGLQNRVHRFALQALDKVLHPNSDRILAGWYSGAEGRVTRRQLNAIADEHDMRRYPSLGGGLGSKMSVYDHNHAVRTFRGVAEGRLVLLNAAQVQEIYGDRENTVDRVLRLDRQDV